MRALSEFRPPEPNVAVIAFCQFLIPLYCRYIDHFTCQFTDDKNSITALKNKRTIILLNHADRQDPSVVVFLAKHLQEQVHCMVAREVFDWYHGVLGWFFQKFGCYSINRGSGDIKSIETTKQILRLGQHKLIVFPEAEITGDDHKVHSISTALVHILLEIQEDIMQIDTSSGATAPDSSQALWVLPVGISYRLETALEPSVEKALKTIEKKIGLKHNDSEIDTRIAKTTTAVLENLAQHYNCQLLETDTAAEQTSHLAHHICQRISNFINSDITHKTPEQVLYSLRNAVDERLGATTFESNYQKALNKGTAKIHDEFIADLNRVENLLIFHRVLLQPPSTIQLCRIVDFLETDTTGQITSKGDQVASVFFGEPIVVTNYLNLYRENKHTAIADLKAAIHDQLQTALDSSQSAKVSLQSRSQT